MDHENPEPSGLTNNTLRAVSEMEGGDGKGDDDDDDDDDDGGDGGGKLSCIVQNCKHVSTMHRLRHPPADTTW